MATYLADTNLLLRIADPASAQHPVATDSHAGWDLVKQLPIHGKRVHDARLVAVLQAHAVERLITFNTSDFAAFKSMVSFDLAFSD
ncbi:MAG: hypothetical protein HYY23_00895 [Verrucomicrobia bacterium]|nr:hypothetical protein [Verrucomicrobiota bacterium]